VRPAERVCVDADHRLDGVTGDCGQVGVVDAGRAQVGDPGVAAVVWPDRSFRRLDLQ
jgi:hypothetical protein